MQCTSGSLQTIRWNTYASSSSFKYPAKIRNTQLKTTNKIQPLFILRSFVYIYPQLVTNTQKGLTLTLWSNETKNYVSINQKITIPMDFLFGNLRKDTTDLAKQEQLVIWYFKTVGSTLQMLRLSYSFATNLAMYSFHTFAGKQDDTFLSQPKSNLQRSLPRSSRKHFVSAVILPCPFCYSHQIHFFFGGVACLSLLNHAHNQTQSW